MRKTWTNVWLKKRQTLDRFLTLQHTHIYIIICVCVELIYGPLPWVSKFDPTPRTPKVLTKDFCLHPNLDWKFMQRRTGSGKQFLKNRHHDRREFGNTQTGTKIAGTPKLRVLKKSPQNLPFWKPSMGHTPSTAGTFRKNSGKIPERPRKRSQSVSWNFPREYGWDAPSPIIQGIWGFQSVSRILSPPVRLGTTLFSDNLARQKQSYEWQCLLGFWEVVLQGLEE